MITLLHGDYIEASRNELTRLKEKAQGKEIRVLDGRTIELSDLTQSLESTSLFGGDLVVVIERLFGKIGKFPKKIEQVASIVAKNGTTDILLWEDKEIGATPIKHLGRDVTVRLFKLPVFIFQLLDGIRAGNAKQLLTLFSQIQETDAPELVFSMVVKRVRQLIQIADGVAPEGVAPWQLGRLTTQRKSFTMGELLLHYAALHDAEVRIKTGVSPFTMAQHLEQFFISL